MLLVLTMRAPDSIAWKPFLGHHWRGIHKSLHHGMLREATGERREPSRGHAGNRQAATHTRKINHPQLNRAQPSGDIFPSSVFPSINQTDAVTLHRLIFKRKSHLTQGRQIAQSTFLRSQQPEIRTQKASRLKAGGWLVRAGRLQGHGAATSSRALGPRRRATATAGRKQEGPRPAAGAGAAWALRGSAPIGRGLGEAPPLPPAARPRRFRSFLPCPSAAGPPEPPPALRNRPPPPSGGWSLERVRRGGRAERGDEHRSVPG